MSTVEVRAKIPLVYLPKNWSRLAEATMEEAEETICTIAPTDYVVDNGLTLRVTIGNGCLDDVLSQIHKLAELLGTEAIIKWRYL